MGQRSGRQAQPPTMDPPLAIQLGLFDVLDNTALGSIERDSAVPVERQDRSMLAGVDVATQRPPRQRPTTLAAVVPEYLAHLAALGRSGHTVKSFQLDLKLLQDHLGDREIGSLELRDLSTFIAWVRLERDNGPTSIRRKIATLKNFATYLYEQGYLATNIAERLIYPDIQIPLPDYLEIEAVDRLLAATEHNIFWRALLLTMIDTGLKRDELLALRRGDVYLNDPPAVSHLIVRATEQAKRLRSRRVPLSDRLREVLQTYLTGETSRVRLFEITPRGVNFIVETCGHNAGVVTRTPKLTPQVLRETFAVNQMRLHIAVEGRARAAGMNDDALSFLMIRHNQEVLELLGLRDDPDNARKYRRLLGEASAS